MKIWKVLKAVMRGELLLGLKVDKIFIHIAYLFFIIWTVIFADLKVEQTMLRRERNRARIEELKIYHAQKTGELAAFDRISTIREMLKEQGSKVTLPEKPAAHIEE